MELWTTFTLECAHSLPSMGYREIHGHSYWLQVFCETNSEQPTHLAELQAEAERIRDKLDHKNLDDIFVTASMETIIGFTVAHWRGPRLTRVIIRRASIGCGVEWRA